MLPVKIVIIYLLLPRMNFIMCAHRETSNNSQSRTRSDAFTPENPNHKAIGLDNSVVENENVGVPQKVLGHFFNYSDLSLSQAVQNTNNSKIIDLRRFRRELKTIDLRCIHQKNYSKSDKFLKRCVRRKLDKTRQKINSKKSVETNYVKKLKAKSIKSTSPVAEVKDKSRPKGMINLSKNEFSENQNINLRSEKNKLKDEEEQRATENKKEDNTSRENNRNLSKNLPGKKNFAAGSSKTTSNRVKNLSKSKAKHKKVNPSFKSEKNRIKIPPKSKEPLPKVDSSFKSEKNKIKTHNKSKKPFPASDNKADANFKKYKNGTKASYKSTKFSYAKNRKPIKSFKNNNTNKQKNRQKFKNSKIPKVIKGKNGINNKIHAIRSSKSSANLAQNFHEQSAQQDHLMKYPENLKSRDAKNNVQRISKEQSEMRTEKLPKNRNTKDISNDFKIGSKFTGSNSKSVNKIRSVIQEHRPLKVLLRKERNKENLLNEVKNFIVKHFAKERDVSYSTLKTHSRETRNSNKDELINNDKLTGISDEFLLTPSKAVNNRTDILKDIKNYVIKNFRSERLKRSPFHKGINSDTFESGNIFNGENEVDLSDSKRSNVENGIRSRVMKRSNNSSVGDTRSMTMSEYDDIYDTNFTDGLLKRDVENQNVQDVDNYNTQESLGENIETTAYSDNEYQTDSYSSSNEDSSTAQNEKSEAEPSGIDSSETTELFYTSSTNLPVFVGIQESSHPDLETISTVEPTEEKIIRDVESPTFSKASESTSVSSVNDIPNPTDTYSFASSEASKSSEGNDISVTDNEAGDMSNYKTESSTNVPGETYSLASENVTNSFVHSSSSENTKTDILTSNDIIQDSSSFSKHEISSSFSPFLSSSGFENSSNGIQTPLSEKSTFSITSNTQNNISGAETSSLSMSRYSSTSSEDINEYNNGNSFLPSVSLSVFAVSTIAEGKTSLESMNVLNTSATAESADSVSNKYLTTTTTTTKASKVHRDVDNVELTHDDNEVPLSDGKLLNTSRKSDKENEYEYDSEVSTESTVYKMATTSGSNSGFTSSEEVSGSPTIFQLNEENSEEPDNQTYILLYSDASTLKFIEETSTDEAVHETSKNFTPGLDDRTTLEDTETINKDENEDISKPKFPLPKIKSSTDISNSDEMDSKRPPSEAEEYEESVDYTSISSSTETSEKVVNENNDEVLSKHIPSASSGFTEAYLADTSPNYEHSLAESTVTLNEDYDEDLEETKTEEVTNHRPKNYYIKTSSFQYLSKKHPVTNLKLNTRKQQRDGSSEKNKSSSPAVAYSVTLQDAKIMPDETTVSTSKALDMHLKSSKSKNEVENRGGMVEEYYDEIAQGNLDNEGLENEKEGSKHGEENVEKRRPVPHGISPEYESFDSSTESNDSETAIASEDDNLDSTDENDESESSTEMPTNPQNFSERKSKRQEKRLVEHLHSLIQRLKQKRQEENGKENIKKVRKVRSIHDVVPLVLNKTNEDQLPPLKKCLIALVGFAFISSVTVGLYRIIVNCHSRRKVQYETVDMDNSLETLENSIAVSEHIHFDDEISNK